MRWLLLWLDSGQPMALARSAGQGSGNAFVLEEGEIPAKDHASYRVELVTLDTIYKQYRIERCDFAKVDIEGFELPFIRGGMGTIKRLRPIIVAEFNDCFMQKRGFTFGEYDRLLGPLGYSWWRRSRRRWVPFDGERRELQTLLLLPKHAAHIVCKRSAPGVRGRRKTV